MKKGSAQLTGNLVKCFLTMLIVILFNPEAVHSQSSERYRDLTHESKVFGHEKFYRIYLPAGYDQSRLRYPVIYFFHGWGGRHFKDDNAKLEYEKIKDLVDKYNVILVMWDGNIELKEPRAYNAGYHEDVKYQVQMADYFPELVNYIDSTYRTLTGRNNRGIIGFSMGGFMSFFLAGKYPDKVCAAVSFAGAPEYFVGYPDNHTLYPIRYTFKNLQGVNLRMYSGDSDILYYLNTEVHQGAMWDGIPIEYRQFHGGHMIDKPGETKVFESAIKFVTDTFKTGVEPAKHWTHYDLYQNFDVRGYHIESDKREPGYIILKNVDLNGFGIYTRRWLPTGPSIHDLHLKVTTPPIYEPNSTYETVIYNSSSGINTKNVVSDSAGKLSFELDSQGNEIGIIRKDCPAEYAAIDYSVGDKGKFLLTDKYNALTIRLLNRGGENVNPQPIRITVSSNDLTVSVKDSVINVTAFDRIVTLPALKVFCTKVPPQHADPPEVKFKLTVESGGNISADEIIVPVLFNVPYFSNIRIDDGTVVRDKIFGKGNGSGSADAGESILVYEGENRLRLYVEDPWVINNDERLNDEIIPAIWGDGYTLSSIIHISPDCPDGHQIECMANYETKSYNPIERKVTWGKVRITVHRN
jgi:enterochelin esterase-like enzyme